MTDTDMLAQLRRLTAIEDIKQLKAEYCLHCDRDYDPAALGQLFTTDAVWDSAGRGRFEGRAAIEAFFATASGFFPWAAHLATNPLIRVSDDAQTATGRWRLIMPATARDAAGQEKAILQASDYDETYRVEGGRWRIATLNVTHRRLEMSGGAWNAR